MTAASRRPDRSIVLPATWAMIATSSDPWADVNWAAEVTATARTPVTNSPTPVPAIAANVARDSPWVKRRLRTVMRRPSPMASPTGLYPLRSNGMSNRTTTTTVIASDVSARSPRQPAIAIVMRASAPTIVSRIGARHRSMTEYVTVPSSWRSMATRTSSPGW